MARQNNNQTLEERIDGYIFKTNSEPTSFEIVTKTHEETEGRGLKKKTNTVETTKAILYNKDKQIVTR